MVLSFGLRASGGSRFVTTAAARACEVVDLLAHVANDRVVVLDLATSSFMDEDFRQWPPSLIAAEQGVDCDVHPLGAWASGTLGLSDELLVMGRGSLVRFLDQDWSPYELSLVDVPAGTTAEQLDELALAVATSSLDEPVLPQLADSRFRFSGHDDHYVSLETRDAALPSLLFARLLALHAGSALPGADDASPVRLPDPGPGLPDRLLAESPHWIGTTVGSAASGATVTLNLSPRPAGWRIGQPPPATPRYTASLDLSAGSWELSSAAGR
jgi:hypothetical protein